MEEIIKDLLISMGGGIAVWLGFLVFFKESIWAFINNAIENSFEKNVEKYRNVLARSTKAYEILLENEMQFYNQTNSIFAEFIPLVQDMLYYLEKDEDYMKPDKFEAYKVAFDRYITLVKELKNTILIYQAYTPEKILRMSTEIVAEMQEDSEYWHDMGVHLSGLNHDLINVDNGKEHTDKILFNIAGVETVIRERLEELSKI